MADPLTTLDLVVVGAVVVALGSAVTALWLASTRRFDRLEKSHDELVKQMKATDEARLREVKDYASRTEATNSRVLTVFGRVVDVLQDLTATVSEWNKRPCISDSIDEHGKKRKTTPLPEVDTAILLRQEDRIKKQHQEESARP